MQNSQIRLNKKNRKNGKKVYLPLLKFLQKNGDQSSKTFITIFLLHDFITNDPAAS